MASYRSAGIPFTKDVPCGSWNNFLVAVTDSSRAVPLVECAAPHSNIILSLEFSILFNLEWLPSLQSSSRKRTRCQLTLLQMSSHWLPMSFYRVTCSCCAQGAMKHATQVCMYAWLQMKAEHQLQKCSLRPPGTEMLVIRADGDALRV